MWGQARSEALARQQSSMQLNQLAPSGGGGAPLSLQVDAGILEERAKKADTVRTNFKEADDKVMAATGRIELKGFKADAALSTFQKRWRSQMLYMDDLLEKGVAGNLRTSAAEFRKEEDRRLRAAKREHGNGGKS
nr:hypothetical protein [Streptomyces sp. SID7804]